MINEETAVPLMLPRPPNMTVINASNNMLKPMYGVTPTSGSVERTGKSGKPACHDEGDRENPTDIYAKALHLLGVFNPGANRFSENGFIQKHGNERVNRCAGEEHYDAV